MEQPLILLQQRATENWLIGQDSRAFYQLALQVRQDLQALYEARSRCQQTPASPLTLLLAERDPLRFLAHAIAACTLPCHLVLANPDWTIAEWQQVFQCVQPEVIWGDGPRLADLNSQRQSSSTKALPPSMILIPTGGSSGKIRFVMHTWETLMASVTGFRQYFGLSQVNSFCVLPLYHVSGLMQFLRSFTSGGKLVVQPFRTIATQSPTDLDPAEFFISLVPTQLQRLLNPEPLTAATTSRHWLARFQTVLLGGAPAWPELLQQARHLGIRLAPTYGMTETASQIATLKPEEFLRGQAGSGQVLPHAQIRIQPVSQPLHSEEHSTKHHLAETNSAETRSPRPPAGIVTIAAESLALGYYPTLFTQPQFQPDDLGFLDAQGSLHVVGRCSDKIITGGENVFPAEVEAAIRATGLVEDVCVLGVDDRTWGQAVTAIYIPRSPLSTESGTGSGTELITETTLKSALVNKLSKFKQPKHWIAVQQLPRNSQGKVNRTQLRAIAATHPTTHQFRSTAAANEPALGTNPGVLSGALQGKHGE